MAGRYINDNFDSSAINCAFVKLRAERRALVKCLRDISPGEEASRSLSLSRSLGFQAAWPRRRCIWCLMSGARLLRYPQLYASYGETYWAARREKAAALESGAPAPHADQLPRAQQR